MTGKRRHDAELLIPMCPRITASLTSAARTKAAAEKGKEKP